MFTLDTKLFLIKPNLNLVQKIEQKILNKEIISDEEIISLLNYIVYLTAIKLKQEHNIDLTTSPMINMCDTVTNIAGFLLEQLGIDIRYLETQQVISSSATGHSFLIANIQENNTYLIDLSYRQFFLKENCSMSKFQKIGNLVIISPDPGYYYEVNREDREVAITILEHGYIKLTEHTAKVYCDSFNTTKRGYKDTSFSTTNISGSIYLSSLLKKSHSHKRRPH